METINQITILIGSEEEVDVDGSAIFSNGGHLGLTQFYNSTSLQSDHASCEI